MLGRAHARQAKSKTGVQEMKAAIGVVLLALSVDVFAAPAVTGQFDGPYVETNHGYERLKVQVVDANGPVADAKCTLSNDKGDWKIDAPDTLHVRRSTAALKVECSKDGYDTSSGTLASQPKKVSTDPFHWSSGTSNDDSDDDSVDTLQTYPPVITVTLRPKSAT
jgi:hypothetical protein